MGGLPANDTDAAEVDKAMQELADGFLGASGELSSGDEWTSTPPSNAAGGTADTGGTSGNRGSAAEIVRPRGCVQSVCAPARRGG